MQSPRDGEILYLSYKDIQKIAMPMTDIIHAVEDMFGEKGRGRTEMPPKPGIHTQPDAFIHAMPAYIPKIGAAGMKWVSGYPENQKKKLPYITGLLILNDPETGIPMCVMDCTWITAQRTGAATAVAAKYLARKESSSLGILACGVQGRSHLEALLCTFPIKKVYAYDLHKTVAKNFANDMEEKYQVEIQVVDESKQAVVESDIVVTSGPILKNPTPSIDAGWVKRGAFISPVDFDSYWTGAALQEMDKIITDDISQMNYYRQVGYFKNTPQVFADLGEIVAGLKPGRENPEERTAAINLGIALDDMATALPLYQRALELKIGTRLPL